MLWEHEPQASAPFVRMDVNKMPILLIYNRDSNYCIPTPGNNVHCKLYCSYNFNKYVLTQTKLSNLFAKKTKSPRACIIMPNQFFFKTITTPHSLQIMHN